MPEDTIIVKTSGHAGQSIAAFAPQGLTIQHTGDANDYVGKGLSGGKICIKAPKPEREKDIIVGNVCFMVLPPERRILMVVLANDFVFVIAV